MGVNRMTGTPWHVEQFSRKDGDERRHRSRCKYFQRSDSYCIFNSERCRGSAHCPKYCEENLDTESDVVTKTKKKETEVSVIDGRRMFPVGCRVIHKVFGKGRVLEVAEGRIRVKFDTGKETMFGLDICVKNNLLVRDKNSFLSVNLTNKLSEPIFQFMA